MLRQNETIRTKIFQVLHPARIIIASFVTGIIIGAFLLTLPIASHDEPLPVIDAFFTATSAICVTGLIVVDTGSCFTHFGQLVILALIQVGGLGIMVFSTFLVIVFGRHLSIRDRFMAKETLLGQISYKNLFSLLKYILAVTFVVEAIGMLCLFPRLHTTLPAREAWYYALFHSISAYCNAGFALFRRSFIPYSQDPVINITLICLIILGGLGFPVLYEFLSKLKDIVRLRRLRFSLHFRIVTIASAMLLVIGAVLMFCFEINNPLHHDYKGISILEAVFQSATARTAGFNTVEIANLSNPSLFLLIMLMFIGGSPASTAGGVKTTTLVVFLALIRARLFAREKVDLFHRSVPSHVVYKVLALIVFSMFYVILVNIVLQITEVGFVPHNDVAGSFLITLFETASAFGTVGLSMGATPDLTAVGKWIIMITMLVGRIGPLTFAVALMNKERKLLFEYPEDSPMIG